jgi:hypothetical protein
MFLRKQIDDVGFSTEEVGLAFVHSNDTQQRQILLAMAAGARQWIHGTALARGPFSVAQ